MTALTIGDRIRAAREAQGWTQAQLSEAIGVDQSYMSRVECGHIHPGSPTLRALSAALGVSADYLLALDGDAVDAGSSSEI